MSETEERTCDHEHMGSQLPCHRQADLAAERLYSYERPLDPQRGGTQNGDDHVP